MYAPGSDLTRIIKNSDDLCVRYSDSQEDSGGTYAEDLRKFLLARGWSETEAATKWAGGIRLAFRREDLLLLVRGDWDDDPYDDAVGEGSFWRIVVGGRPHDERQLLEVLNREP